jgi:predicted DNA-binding ribbon-helix-helix protein
MCAASNTGDDLRMKVVPVVSQHGSPHGSAAELPSETSAVSELRHRILQANGRRYSINIEESYWTILDKVATRLGVRVSQLVHRIASADPNAPLAATLRLFCLREAVREAETLARKLDESKRTSGPSYVQSLVAANPSPAILVGHGGTIQAANAPFARWSRTPIEKLVGQRYEWFFQLRAAPRLQDIVAKFAAGSREVYPARISYIAPGRVVVAKANLCLAATFDAGEYTWAVQIEDATPRGS